MVLHFRPINQRRSGPSLPGGSEGRVRRRIGNKAGPPSTTNFTGSSHLTV